MQNSVVSLGRPAKQRRVKISTQGFHAPVASGVLHNMYEGCGFGAHRVRQSTSGCHTLPIYGLPFSHLTNMGETYFSLLETKAEGQGRGPGPLGRHGRTPTPLGHSTNETESLGTAWTRSYGPWPKSDVLSPMLVRKARELLAVHYHRGGQDATFGSASFVNVSRRMPERARPPGLLQEDAHTYWAFN
jgi:hypothetical protein